MPGLERPPPVVAAFGLYQLDRLVHAPVGRDLGAAQILDLA